MPVGESRDPDPVGERFMSCVLGAVVTGNFQRKGISITPPSGRSGGEAEWRRGEPSEWRRGVGMAGQIAVLRCTECGEAIRHNQRRSRLCESCLQELRAFKNWAHWKSKQLIRQGKLRSRPDCCEECGSTEYAPQLHHLNYHHPERILWLCPGCHTRWHEKNGGAYGRPR